MNPLDDFGRYVAQNPAPTPAGDYKVVSEESFRVISAEDWRLLLDMAELIMQADKLSRYYVFGVDAPKIHERCQEIIQRKGEHGR